MTEGTERVRTGDAGLDEVLGGGLAPRHVYLIGGASGAGKTTLCLQFLLEGVRQGERVLYIGTSETKSELQAIAASHGWSLDGITHHHHAVQLDEEQSVLQPTEFELPQTIDTILSVVDDVSPTRLVIDSMAEIRLLAQDLRWYRRQLMKLRANLVGRPGTVLLVDIPGPDGHDESALNSIVSGVIHLEPSTPHYGPMRRSLRVLKMRGQNFITGYHDYRIRTGGLEVFPRLVAAVHRRRFEHAYVSTGLSELDAALGGGLSQGTSTLLLGPSGTGKSVVASQIAVAAAQRDERCDMYIFDERVQTLFQRADGIGLPLAQHAEEGLINVQQVDPAELTPGEFSHKVRTSVERDQLKVLIIDSLNGYDYAMPGERVLSVHLHELASFLAQQGITSVFTMTQHGLLGSQVKAPFEVSYIADSVVLFQHVELQSRVHKVVSVYKNRTGWHDTSIRRLQISENGVVIGEPLVGFDNVLNGRPVLTEDSFGDGDASRKSDD